ncbi:MAG: hypothetical protein HGA20_16360 [Geobacteraceae bacterium]|nr:hypothetical protein [Geobacteraceae bacterium]
MNRSSTSQNALSGAYRNAELAFEAVNAMKYKHVPKADKVVWAVAALIHCDMCRALVSLDKCEPGFAKLLSMMDIASKLYEAKKWYLGAGSKALRQIASRKSCGTQIVDQKLKELKAIHPIGRADNYTDYRNKVGHHYCEDTPEQLLRFGQEDSDEFYSLLTTFARFSGEWVKLTKTVIQATTEP